MSEPEQEPPEKKLSRWKQFMEDASWDIPGARAFGNLFLGIFVQEGKAVKSGWIAFLVFTVLAFWGGCHYSDEKIDAKLAGITNYFSGELAKKETEISTLKGEWSDAKQERDKYQLMLAPFEAMAIAKYTNAPIDQRLDLLAGEMAAITNALSSMIFEKPNLITRVNGIVLTNVDNAPSAIVPATQIQLEKTMEIKIWVRNLSKKTAQHIVIDFQSQIDPTNLMAGLWTLQPQSDNGFNHWRIVSSDSTPQYMNYAVALKITPGFQPGNLPAFIGVSADDSTSSEYCVVFTLNNNKSVTNIVDRPK
jgi:hypothetical protein